MIATRFALAAAASILASLQGEGAPPPRLPRYEIVSRFVATEASGSKADWKVERIEPRRFAWKTVPAKDPGPPPEGLLPVDRILARVPVFSGSTVTLADMAKEPFPSEKLEFNRANGVIGEAYDSLFPDAPRLRRVSVPIYADLDRIKTAEGRYVDWPKSFERLAPEEGSMIEYPDARTGPERRWRAFTESNPGAMLKNFEYGLALREYTVGKALVNAYRLSGPRSAWVKTFSGVDVLTPLEAPNGYPAYLMTTVIDLHIEFNVGNPGDGSVLAFMETTLLALKDRVEKRSE